MRPSSVEEAADVLAAAAREGRRLRIGEELEIGGLDRVLEHEAGDLTCTVEAGIRLSALQAALAEAGQRLSLDPPGDPTLGACLAGRLSGPLSHRHGTPRDLEAFERVRRAFDPDGIANPGKVIPTPRLCGEVPGPYRSHPLERLGLAERF